MAFTTITGRVRATVRLKEAGEGGDRVVASSWASDRAFPRTIGTAVVFELEAGDGAIYRIDPFEALVTLPVRRRGEREGVRHEEAWIGVAEEITVEGELERGGRRLPPAVRALRIAAAKGPDAPHRLPPRSLKRGEGERVEAPPAGKAAKIPVAVAPPEVAVAPPEVAVATPEVAAASPEVAAASPEVAAAPPEVAAATSEAPAQPPAPQPGEPLAAPSPPPTAGGHRRPRSRG